MYNVILYHRPDKKATRIDFQNKNAKEAWKLYAHWRRKYFYENYWVLFCKDEYLRAIKCPVFNMWDELNFSPIVKKILMDPENN